MFTGTSTFNTSTLKRGSENNFIASLTFLGLTFANSTLPLSGMLSSYVNTSKKNGISSATHSEPILSIYAFF